MIAINLLCWFLMWDTINKKEYVNVLVLGFSLGVYIVTTGKVNDYKALVLPEKGLLYWIILISLFSLYIAAIVWSVRRNKAAE